MMFDAVITFTLRLLSQFRLWQEPHATVKFHVLTRFGRVCGISTVQRELGQERLSLVMYANSTIFGCSLSLIVGQFILWVFTGSRIQYFFTITYSACSTRSSNLKNPTTMTIRWRCFNQRHNNTKSLVRNGSFFNNSLCNKPPSL